MTPFDIYGPVKHLYRYEDPWNLYAVPATPWLTRYYVVKTTPQGFWYDTAPVYSRKELWRWCARGSARSFGKPSLHQARESYLYRLRKRRTTLEARLKDVNHILAHLQFTSEVEVGVRFS